VSVVLPESMCAETPMFRCNLSRCWSCSESCNCAFFGSSVLAWGFLAKAAAADAARMMLGDPSTSTEGGLRRTARRHDCDPRNSVSIPCQCQNADGRNWHPKRKSEKQVNLCREFLY
jgi:hypothetical protein